MKNIVSTVAWPRAYDVIIRLAFEFSQTGRLTEYSRTVNQILAVYGVVWDLDENGKLARVLPDPAAEHVTSAIHRLEAPEFESARELLRAAQEAFNAIPRRERDTCANVSMQWRRWAGGNTFGRVLDNLQAGDAIDSSWLR